MSLWREVQEQAAGKPKDEDRFVTVTLRPLDGSGVRITERVKLDIINKQLDDLTKLKNQINDMWSQIDKYKL